MATGDHSTEAFSDTTSDNGLTAIDEVPAKTEATGEANIIVIAHPEGQGLGKRYRLVRGAPLEIGRARAATASFPEVRSVSRLHARLCHGADGVTIEDLGSTNGTYVNDQPVDGPTRLTSGDRFQVGSVYFKFLQGEDVEAAYYETIHQLAIRDGLTDIYNRRRFEEELGRELRRARRYRRPLALVLFDIDRFKKVNDTYGHLGGDFLLHEMASVCRSELRREEVFARVGGDEFAILSPELRTADAVSLAEKLRRVIGAKDWAYGDQPLVVSCSFGVAELEPGHLSGEDLYAVADRALYAAKDRGGDRVEAHLGLKPGKRSNDSG